MLKKKKIVITDAEIMAEMDKIVIANKLPPWSEREVALLRAARAKGVGMVEIVKRWKDWTGIERTYESISGKIRRLVI